MSEIVNLMGCRIKSVVLELRMEVVVLVCANEHAVVQAVLRRHLAKYL